MMSLEPSNSYQNANVPATEEDTSKVIHVTLGSRGTHTTKIENTSLGEQRVVSFEFQANGHWPKLSNNPDQFMSEDAIPRNMQDEVPGIPVLPKTGQSPTGSGEKSFNGHFLKKLH